MNQTVLHEKQLQANAKMAEIQGWRIPLQYTSVQEEYYAVRKAAGLFDVSFLGRIEICGRGAAATLQKLFSRNIAKVTEGSACYGVMCNEAGFIINDGYIYHLSPERYLVTTDSVTIEKVRSSLTSHANETTRVTDLTGSLAQVSLQGPSSAQILEKIAGSKFKIIRPKSLCEISILDTPVIVSRTGYTGEHGYELFLDSSHAAALWDALLSTGKEYGLLPCGFESRDVLRLEMGYPLYGNELDETRTPIEAGLRNFIDFKKDFLAKEALMKIAAEEQKQTLVGIELFDKSVPKKGNILFSDNHEIGIVTSGCQSPSVRKGIALGYVSTRYAKPGIELEIEAKDRELPGRIVEVPFYRKK